MLNDDDYSNLPEDPREAFLLLVERYRSKHLVAIKQQKTADWAKRCAYEYANNVVSAALELGVSEVSGFKLPEIVDPHLAALISLDLAVDRLAIQSRIRKSRRIQQCSISLDEVMKEEIQDYIDQIERLGFKLSDETRKNHDAKIETLRSEVESGRVRIDTVYDLILTTNNTDDETGQKLKLITDAITKLLSKLKASEPPAFDRLSLPG